MKKLVLYIFSCCLLLGVNTIFAQKSEPKKIDYKSDRSIKNEEKYPGAFILSKVTNQVYFYHEGIKVWCDQAIFYQKDDFFKAYGNVRMVQGDTVTLTSKYAEYNGQTKFAFASNDVSLKTPSNTLTTDSLFFNRAKQESFYRSGGKLKDSATTVTSKIGRYYMTQKKYSFVTDVVVTNPKYVIDSDQIDFYEETGNAYLYGPSTITSENSKIYCERGYYDTRGDQGYFVQNSTVYYENRKLQGDSIYFDRKSNFASATNNIKVTDTANESVIRGHYAEVFRDKDSVFITKRALASMKQEQDSIHIHSDTLMITGKPEHRIIRGFYNTRMYKSDMSGKCDSVRINERTGVTKMIGRPIVWSGENQLTGDTIHLLQNNKTNKLDSLKVFYNAFMVQKDSIDGFNQVKGKEMYGLFEDNELTEADFIKNTETIYYARKDNSDLIGISKALSSSIKVLFEDQEVVSITYFDDVKETLHQPESFPKNARTLKGLNWRGEEQILSKEQLFEDDPPLELPKIEGIPLREENKEFFDEPEEGDEPLMNENSRLSPNILKNQEQEKDSLFIESDSLRLPKPKKDPILPPKLN